jgi:hypothetical protein
MRFHLFVAYLDWLFALTTIMSPQLHQLALLEMTESHVIERSWQRTWAIAVRVGMLIRVLYQCPDTRAIENKTRAKLHANAEGYRCLQSRGNVRPQAPTVACCARAQSFFL